MAPRRRNQEGDLPQTSVEEKQVAGADAGHGGGSSSNLAGEVAPPQSVPSVDLGGTRTRSLDGVNTTNNFNGSASISTANGLNGQLHVENFPPHVASQLPTHRANHGDIPPATHVEGPHDAGMGELPPHGETSIPTFNIPVDQPPAQGFGQPSAIPMTRPYVAPANMGGGSNLGGDHIPPRAYPRPIPPQFNGQGMDPLRFMPPPGGHDVNVLRDQVTQLLTEQLGMGVRSTIPPVYRKPYPEWVDRHHPFPRGFRVPKFPPSHGWATSPPWSMLDGSLSNVVTWVIL
ncbi:hypothetical protein LINGRAHAP2_LOCUS4338 [Linum grandiflorum]